MKYSKIIIENGITGERVIVHTENFTIATQIVMLEDIMIKHITDRVPFYVTYAYD